ncbi:MAG: alpha/beta hydrolase-fold protein [Planctomycetales bacterium]
MRHRDHTMHRLERLNLTNSELHLPAASDGEDPALLAPQHYEPGYQYPLLVWLHGRGEDQRQLRRIMPMLSLRNYVSVAPQGARRDPSGGRGWGEREGDLSLAADRIFQAVEKTAARYNIREDRVFLMGHGEGGTTALRIALRDPRRFAGVVSLEGKFPTGRRPLACFHQSRQLPVLMTRTRDSREYPLEDAGNDSRLLSLSGMTVSLKEYPAGPALCKPALADVNRWLMELVVRSSTTATPV